MNLATENFWDDNYKHVYLNIAPPNDVIRRWLQIHIPLGKDDATCLEIGCFPGTYLAVMGKMNYKLYGVDWTERMLSDLPLWLKEQGCQIGELYQEDFLSFASHNDMTFDVVCSFGFIEHFINWPEILDMHARKVSKGGLLVVTVPNFAGLLQRSLHSILDSENLKHHNIDAMCPRKWKKQLESEGFCVSFVGQIGNFDFWINNPHANLIQRFTAALVIRLIPLLQRLPACSLYSPFYGIIARKIS